MSELSKPNAPLHGTAQTFAAAGIGAAACGSAAVALGRHIADSMAVTAMTLIGGIILGGAVGVFASIAVASRLFRQPQNQDPDPEAAAAATYLKEQLGLETTAFLSGLDEPGTVQFWVSGEASPDSLTRDRLLRAYEVTRRVVSVYDGETAQAWLFGQNPRLDDEAPAEVLRYGHRSKHWSRVIPAAKEFAESSF